MIDAWHLLPSDTRTSILAIVEVAQGREPPDLDHEVRFVERPLLLDCHVNGVAISRSLCEGCLPCKIVPDSLLV